MSVGDEKRAEDVDDGWTANPEDIAEVRELRELRLVEAKKLESLKSERRWKEPWEQ